MSTAALYTDFVKYELGKELIDGRVVRMAPVGISHSSVSMELSDVLRPYFRNSPCRLLADVFVHLSKKDIVAPDLCVVCDPNMIKGEAVYGTPDLVVEILSPTTANTDKVRKMKKYAKYGVKEYWIANPRGKDIEVYYNEGDRFALQKVYYASYDEFALDVMDEEERSELTYEITTPLFDGLVVDVREVFKDIP